MIDADASPSGYIAWYNHRTESSKIISLRPARKNERFGVQRMELLVIYFALRDNLAEIHRTLKGARRKRLMIEVRSDSKSTVEQLQGAAEIRDLVMRRIVFMIGKLLAKIGSTTIVFGHLERTRNIAGLMLEQRRKKERERQMEMAIMQARCGFVPLPLCA